MSNQFENINQILLSNYYLDLALDLFPIPELLLPLFSFCNSLSKAQIMATLDNKRCDFSMTHYGHCSLKKFEPPSFELYENLQKQNYQASVDFLIHNEDWTF